MSGLIDPADGAFVVVPSNTANLTDSARSLWVGGAGTLKVDMLNGNTVTFSGILAGTLLPIQVKRVYSTGTSATLILGLR